MSQRHVQSSTLGIMLGITLCITGCSTDHKEESREIAEKLAEEMIEQQIRIKPDSGTKAKDARARELEAELLDAGLSADEVRLMLDSLQQKLTAAQKKDTVKTADEIKKNGKPDSTSH
jgi:hypothetical protein